MTAFCSMTHERTRKIWLFMVFVFFMQVHYETVSAYRTARLQAFIAWQDVTCTSSAA